MDKFSLKHHLLSIEAYPDKVVIVDMALLGKDLPCFNKQHQLTSYCDKHGIHYEIEYRYNKKALANFLSLQELYVDNSKHFNQLMNDLTEDYGLEVSVRLMSEISVLIIKEKIPLMRMAAEIELNLTEPYGEIHLWNAEEVNQDKLIKSWLEHYKQFNPQIFPIITGTGGTGFVE